MGLYINFIFFFGNEKIMQGLTARYEERKYKEMDFNFSRLKQFELHVASESYLNPSDIANFLKKCPRVERVSIDVKKLILKLSSFFFVFHIN